MFLSSRGGGASAAPLAKLYAQRLMCIERLQCGLRLQHLDCLVKGSTGPILWKNTCSRAQK